MAAINDEKIAVGRVDEHADHSSNSDSITAAPKNAEEAIIRDLNTQGEEIGLTWRTIMAVISMTMCYNAYLFTLLIPPAILTFINTELGPDIRYTWITISWNLGGAMFVTVGGRLSDIFGRRYFFLTGGCLLIIGSIVSATGKSIGQMIAGGALFGAGSGFLEMAFGAVQEIVPAKHRMICIGIFDAGSIIAQLMPLTAWGIIKTTHNWRIAYYMMIGFQSLTVVFLFFFYHPPTFDVKHRNDGKTRWEMVKEMDFLGIFLFISGCTLFIVGLSWGGTLHPWKSGSTLGPIIVGFMTLVTLGLYEAYADLKAPLMPRRLFKQSRHFTVPMLVMAITGMQYYSNATLWPRLSQLLYATDEISKGLYSEVLPLGTILGGIWIMFSKRIGHQRWQIFGAIAVQTACVGAMSTASITKPIQSIILTVIISMCTSIVILNSLVLVGFGIVSQNDIGASTGLAGTARLLAGSIAIAIFSSVTTNKYRAELPVKVRSAAASVNFSGNITRLITAAGANTAAGYAAVPGINAQTKAATTLANKQAYLEGAHLSYQVALAFGLCGCIAALFIPSIDPRKYTSRTVALQDRDRIAIETQKKDLS